MCSVAQYSDGVEYAELCFNATLVQATRINKEVSDIIVHLLHYRAHLIA